MFKNKKLTGVLALGLILAGCGGVGTSDTSTTSGIKTLVVSGPKEEEPVYAELVKRYNAQPGMTDETKVAISFKDIGEGNAREEILKDVDVAPDVFMFADDQMDTLYKQSVLAELSPGYQTIVEGRDSASSVLAASAITENGDVLHAFPISDDNGYFLYYNSDFLSETDVLTLEGILAKTDKDHQLAIDLGTAYYAGTFILNTAELSYNPETKVHSTTLGAKAVKALEAAAAIIQPKIDLGFKSANVDNEIDNFKDENKNTVIAGVSGIWNAGKMEEAMGEKMRATKLPEFTVDGEQINMASFAGSKLVGVKSSSANQALAMSFAEFITNEESQAYRYSILKKGPSNKVVSSSDEVKENRALAALGLQAEFALPQARSVGGSFWDAAAPLGVWVGTPRNASDPTAQVMIDQFVTAITTSATAD